MARAGQPDPDLAPERAWAAELGTPAVAGVDEAGRGALAGPVVAAAVLLPLDDDALTGRLRGVRDSKLLSPVARENLYQIIVDNALAVGVGFGPAEWIDQYGILSATRQAMTEAVSRLWLPPQAVLVDGPLPLVGGNLRQRPLVRGDSLSMSIAAASILAKVSRDRWMVALDERYPEYGFAQHKGYGTRQHLVALARLGPCPEHRRSFAPLRAGLF
jgi:ribonuclease HII